MATFRERMYPVGSIVQKLEIEGDTYDVELRAPKWDEVIRAESRATQLLKDIIKNPVDAHGMPLPMSPQDRRVLNMQTGIELAKVCVVCVGGVSTAEDNFWDRQSAPILTALGGMVMDLIWDTEVGRKNSMPPGSPQRILRKIRKPVPPTSSPTPSSEESTSSGSSSGTATVTLTSER